MLATSTPSAAPLGSQAIPKGGAVTEKIVGAKLDGTVTAVEVKRQTGSGDAHLKHWWIMFNVTQGTASGWMQVDLNLNDGYLVIWTATKQKPLKEGDTPPSLGFEPVGFPNGLTSAQVLQGIATIASQRKFYSNPKVPTAENPRYSCQTFVQELAGNLGINL